ncbi:MAG: hypothetical protein Fur0010_23890 [Bdellovibrio sp.]
MTYKLSKNQSFYCQKRLVDSVHTFLLSHGIQIEQRRLVVAVSGGKDSMFLLWLAQALFERGFCREVVCAHVHHGIRQESDDELELVRSYAEQLKVTFVATKLQLKRGSNFEKRARMARHSWLRSQLHHRDLLLMGHHIDDSFEWSLLSSFRSSSLKSQIGIPLINGPIIRPLMCLTRQQISQWVDYFCIPFAQDASNQDLRFERNYIRQKLIPLIAKRHPQYLKHYVQTHTELAKRYNLWARPQAPKAAVRLDPWGGTWIEVASLSDWDFQIELIADTIKSYSNQERGTLQGEILKLIVALKNHKRGPHLFSGNVWAFMFDDRLLIMGQQQLEKWQSLDESLASGALEFDRHDLLLIDSPDRSSRTNLRAHQIRRPFVLLPRFSAYLLQRNYFIYSALRMNYFNKRHESLLHSQS